MLQLPSKIQQFRRIILHNVALLMNLLIDVKRPKCPLSCAISQLCSVVDQEKLKSRQFFESHDVDIAIYALPDLRCHGAVKAGSIALVMSLM